ncbi:Hypothetical protein PROPAUS_1824, partial [Propionibacterium australiense]
SAEYTKFMTDHGILPSEEADR